LEEIPTDPSDFCINIFPGKNISFLQLCGNKKCAESF